MTRIWTPLGRALAGFFLALAVSACSTMLPNRMALAPASSFGNGLSNDSKSGSGEVAAESPIEEPSFVGLYQTSLGPMLYREGKLYALSSGEVREWGKAPRAGMAWSIVMLSAQEGWSVGAEGIARYKNQVWEPVVNSSHELLAPGANNGATVQLTDVAFAGSSLGYAVGTHGTVLRYDEKAWNRLSDAAFGNKHFGTVRLASATDVWVAGEDVLHFDGTRWESLGLPEAGAAVSGLVVLSDSVWASTGDALWRWDRTEHRWSKPQPDLIAGYVGAPQPVPGKPGSVVAWAMDVGTPGGLLYRLGSGGSWDRVTAGTPLQVGLDSLVMRDAETGFALSFDGSVLYRFEAGSWSPLSF